MDRADPIFAWRQEAPNPFSTPAPTPTPNLYATNPSATLWCCETSRTPGAPARAPPRRKGAYGCSWRRSQSSTSCCQRSAQVVPRSIVAPCGTPG